MRNKWLMIAAIIGIVFIGIVAVGPIMNNVETPNYEILKSQGNIEIRRYNPMLVAEVQMSGNRKDAIVNGFRILVNYIFGNNVSSKAIAMTAPVQQQSIGDNWKISFVMPSQYTMETLPKPLSDSVTLKVITAKNFVVITFSGTNLDENLQEHENILLEHIKSTDFLVVGSPKYAFYNPPWTPPFMRRNEIMIEIQE